MEIIKKSPDIPTEATLAIQNIESPAFLINFVASNMNADVDEKQRILEESDLAERAKRTLRYLTKEEQIIDIKNDIQSKVKFDIPTTTRIFLAAANASNSRRIGRKSSRSRN